MASAWEAGGEAAVLSGAQVNTLREEPLAKGDIWGLTVHSMFMIRSPGLPLAANHVAYARFGTPIGTLLVAATEVGLVRVAFAVEDHDDVLADLSERVSPRLHEAPEEMQPFARQFEDYLSGERRGWNLPLDLRLAHGFRAEVLQHLMTIPYGETESYGEVAAALGRPRASRAVGTACATNPLPIVIPCHRVLRSDGSLGGYGGHPELKQRLLAMEARSAFPQQRSGPGSVIGSLGADVAAASR